MKIFCVLGAGTMGAGIAQWLATSGKEVFLSDTNPNILKKAKDSIENSYHYLVSKNKFSELQTNQFIKNIHFVSSFNEAPSNTDIVIEAIVENLEIKQQVFSKLDEHFSKNTIFASNTSGLSIEKIFSKLSARRCCGLHFFNPAPIMKLVEIVKSTSISSEDLNLLRDFFLINNKKPAIVEDRPGFICNRVARNFYGESFRILTKDSPNQMQEIDFVLKHIAGFKMGPFELIDLIGVDINLNATKGVFEAFGQHPRFSPHKIQEQAVKEGRLGRKTNNNGLIIGRASTDEFSLKNISPNSDESSIIVYDELSHDFPENSVVFDKTLFNLEEKIELLKILKERNNHVIVEGSHLSNDILPTINEMNFDLCNSLFVLEKNNSVELISTSGNEKIIQDFSNHIKKNVIIRNEKTLGLIAPRILMQIIFEATVAFEEKLASKEDIDSAMKYGLNYPQGPFEWQNSISTELVEALRLNMCHTISRKPNRYTR
jgi:3-hydroxybutyryl-CoA dehydrogenase